MSEQSTDTKTSASTAASWFDAESGANPATANASRQTATTQARPPAGSPVDGGLIGRTSIALLTVIGVILVCAFLLKRLGLQRERATERLNVVASRSLGQRERVVIVEVEDEWLVLGVTAHNINALARRSAPAEREPPNAGCRSSTTPPSFGRALATNIGRLGRRRPR